MGSRKGLSVSREFIGKKAQMGSGHKEKDLEATQTRSDHFNRPVKSQRRESKRACSSFSKSEMIILAERKASE